jgi:hypothetical protein
MINVDDSNVFPLKLLSCTQSELIFKPNDDEQRAILLRRSQILLGAALLDCCKSSKSTENNENDGTNEKNNEAFQFGGVCAKRVVDFARTDAGLLRVAVDTPDLMQLYVILIIIVIIILNVRFKNDLLFLSIVLIIMMLNFDIDLAIKQCKKRRSRIENAEIMSI